MRKTSTAEQDGSEMFAHLTSATIVTDDLPSTPSAEHKTRAQQTSFWGNGKCSGGSKGMSQCKTNYIFECY